MSGDFTYIGVAVIRRRPSAWAAAQAAAANATPATSPLPARVTSPGAAARSTAGQYPDQVSHGGRRRERQAHNLTAKPSREMLLILTSVLEVPRRDRNLLLQAAGFAPVYRETSLEAPEMAAVRRALDFLLTKQLPYAAVAMDRHWNVVRSNPAWTQMLGFFGGADAGATDGSVEQMRWTFHSEGSRPYIANFDEIGAHTVARMHRETTGARDAETTDLLDELLSHEGVPESRRRPELRIQPSLLLPLELSKDGLELSCSPPSPPSAHPRT